MNASMIHERSLIAAALHAKYASAVCISDQGPHFWEDCEAKDQWLNDAEWLVEATQSVRNLLPSRESGGRT